MSLWRIKTILPAELPGSKLINFQSSGPARLVQHLAALKQYIPAIADTLPQVLADFRLDDLRTMTHLPALQTSSGALISSMICPHLHLNVNAEIWIVHINKPLLDRRLEYTRDTASWLTW